MKWNEKGGGGEEFNKRKIEGGLKNKRNSNSNDKENQPDNYLKKKGKKREEIFNTK